MTIKINRKFIVLTVIVVSLLSTAAVAAADKPNWFSDQEKLSDRIAETQINNTQYPEAQMQHSLERQNLKDRLLRFNNPNKIGYLYLMSFGKFVGYYSIRGKVTSTQSSMTNTVQTFHYDGGGMQVPSIGDDGSFGSNEGGDKGVFFFTTQKVMVETTLDWVYSDSPLSIDVPNLIAKKP